ncbi:hypothetical protein REMIM1_PE00192 (plasmid) [Rhizobium etli bv. mimosae str. Mim1]|nr:hypothetical protein REMIM1_PE00192 [Rhizobium etli bv. mimosae str. Mim1]
MGICGSKHTDGASVSHSTARSDRGASHYPGSDLLELWERTLDDMSTAQTSMTSEPTAMAARVALGTSPNTLQQRRGAALQPHESPQLAYLVAATMTDDPVRSPARFPAAGQTVHDVRLLLNHGRGNIDADYERSGGYSVPAAGVAYTGYDRHNKMALAGALGAGFCDHFANLAAVSHAPHLRDGELVVNAGGQVEIEKFNADNTISSTRTGHVWNELRLGNGRDGETTIVQDAWSNGPAVRLKDSAWAKVQVEREPLSLDKGSALRSKHCVENLIPLVHPAADENTAKRLQHKLRNPTERDRFLETQVVSAEFAAKARKALKQMPAEKKEQFVSTAGQEFYGLSPDEAGDPNFINSVLEQVGLLDNQDRPPVVPPRDALNLTAPEH